MQNRTGREYVEDMKNERNLGIDLLRMVCMFLVVLVHVLDYSRITTGSKLFSVNYDIAWFLNIASKCAVNCYALITGYVYVDAKFKISNIIQMWVQVLFYSVGITLLFRIFQPGVVGTRTLLTSVLPLTTDQYWYFTQYFCMFFFIPFFNHLLNTLKPLQLRQLIVTILILFSFLNLFTNSDLFYVADGFSALWLSFMYLIGGYLKRNPSTIGWSKKKALGIYCVCVVMTFLSKWLLQLITYKFLGEAKDGSRFMLYTSPTIILSAVSLLCAFSKLHIRRGEKVIRFFAPLSFSVFLIHCHKLVLQYIMPGLLSSFIDGNPFLMMGAVLGVTLGIYLGCTIIDFGRVRLFKLLRIQKFSEWLAEKGNRIFARIVKRVYMD